MIITMNDDSTTNLFQANIIVERLKEFVAVNIKRMVESEL